jgi:LAO/AO transport system kinase
VINKADRDGADRMMVELEVVLELQRKEHEWDYPVVKTEAREGLGVDLLLEQIDRQEEHLARTGYLQKHKRDLLRAEILQLLSETIEEKVETRLVQEGRLDEAVAGILRGELDPYQAVDQLLANIEGVES